MHLIIIKVFVLLQHELRKKNLNLIIKADSINNQQPITQK